MRRAVPRSGAAAIARALRSALAALALAAPAVAPAQADSAPPPPASYWGPFPARGDSVTVAFDNRPLPLWESVLVWPYRVVTVPFTLLRAGFGVAVTAADRGHVPERIAQLLGPRPGPFGILVHVSGGGLSGVGGGVTARYDDFPGTGQRTRASLTSSFRGDHRVRLGMEIPLHQNAAAMQLGAGYRIRPNARFFGFGPEAAAADESYYRHRLTWLGASYRRPLASHLAIEAQGLWSEVAALATDAADPPLADRFATALPEGYGQYAAGISASVALVHDNTAQTGRPGRGGVRRARAVVFRGVGSPRVAFAGYRAELQQFFTVGHPQHVLAVRAVGSWMAPLAAQAIPFQYLPTNDDPDLFRGYQDFRWRDRGMALVSAEYRWPLWALKDAAGPGVDVYLLGDLGQVFGAASQLARRHVTVSYGAGLRLLGRGGLVARLEYGRSADEWVLRLRGDQVFQFARNALFYGRDPVPFR